ncbi:putative TBC1 domain family member 5-like [Triplophysa rosa]|uniref:TBC1 domain family member 5-like n=1 Tax=Triplophysa rosa TaxID=992332 RepID=A0A9W8C4L7_TRIRA|nr:putative TBC1 domain family member 5-like [Triplophysa rosa]
MVSYCPGVKRHNLRRSSCSVKKNFLGLKDVGSIHMDGSFSLHESSAMEKAKEWAEIFLNSNYLARIRQRGINGGTRSIGFQRCVRWKKKEKGLE